MSRITIGPIRVVEAAPDLDGRLPRPNSLRRAGDDAKRAVAAAAAALQAGGIAVTGRVGLYVGMQRAPLEYTVQFIEGSYKDGPRMASPMLFSESVANNAATHLSLTLGFKGVVQTFIGSRCAGIQAVIAARDDLESGAIDEGLVVVLGSSHRVTMDAYNAAYRHRKEIPFQHAAVALPVRREGGTALAYAGTCCFGRGPGQKLQAVQHLWEDAAPRTPEAPVLSRFCLETAPTVEAIMNVTGPITRRAGAEGFALEPFMSLMSGSPVICIGEEGTVGLIALEGPLP